MQQRPSADLRHSVPACEELVRGLPDQPLELDPALFSLVTGGTPRGGWAAELEAAVVLGE